jgi:metal transporter CNNM
MTSFATWIGIIICISQAGMFSGLNLAFFSLSKMRLEIEMSNGNKDAAKVLKLREDSNYLLTTTLWGNVGVNVLLALLSNSVMTGLIAFIFSTFIITIFGEIVPQAYFSRNAMRVASIFSPVIRFYQIILWPLAKPSAKILDMFLGKEAIKFYKESEIEEMLRMHIRNRDSDIDHVEGIGALNFLAIDDLQIRHEGTPIDPQSIISLEFEDRYPIFPTITPSADDPFLRLVYKSKKSWVVITDKRGKPMLVIDVDRFVIAALFEYETFEPIKYCHRPVIISNLESTLGDTLLGLKVDSKRDIIEKDIVVIWGEDQRIITGTDILGRLLHGIVTK